MNIKHFILLILIAANINACAMKNNHPDNNNPIIFNNNDILSNITHRFLVRLPYTIVGPEHVYELGKNIAHFSLVNRCLYNYYAQEATKQAIIRTLANSTDMSDEKIATTFNAKTILSRIEHFKDIASDKNKSFSPDKLKDTWYIHCTITDNKQSLLIPAIKNNDLQKTMSLVTDGAINVRDIKYDGKSPLKIITEKRVLHNHLKNNNYLDIAEFLLGHGTDPNYSSDNTDYTSLMDAASFGDKAFVRLLVKYDADPYLKKLKFPFREEVNAFDVEALPKGWLQNIIDEVNEEKSKLLKGTHK